MSSTAEFELRARSMGIAEERFVAQKVAIWEGMWVAKQYGDDTGVSILFLSDVIVGLSLIEMGNDCSTMLGSS